MAQAASRDGGGACSSCASSERHRARGSPTPSSAPAHRRLARCLRWSPRGVARCGVAAADGRYGLGASRRRLGGSGLCCLGTCLVLVERLVVIVLAGLVT